MDKNAKHEKSITDKAAGKPAPASGDARRIPPLRWALLVLQGALVGGGAILPGVSGGVLAVVFGIYRPMMAVLAHPIRGLREHWRMFLPFTLGWGLGFLVFAKLLSALFAASSVLTLCAFIGLIAGTLPSLFRDAGKEGSGEGAWTGFAMCLFLLVAAFRFFENSMSVAIVPNGWWFCFCGALWGLSLIVPGLSSSSVLIFLGLFQPLTDGLAAFDMAVIVPFVIGIAVTALSLARLVNYLFERHYSLAYHSIVGIVIASSLVILPKTYDSLGQAALGFALFAAGYAAAWALEHFGGAKKSG